MKSLTIALVALMFIGLGNTQAKAGGHAVDGLIIGAAVGSVVGLIVASEMHRDAYHSPPVYYPPVVYAPPPPRHYGRWAYARHDYRHLDSCRRVVVVRDSPGYYRKSVQRVCW